MSIEDELREARLTIERLNRRCQEMEKQVRLAKGEANDAKSRLQAMKDQADNGMRVLGSMGAASHYFSGDVAKHIGTILAAKEKAEKDLAAVMEGFRTCVIDEGTDACRLAIEDARAQERERCAMHANTTLHSMSSVIYTEVSRAHACQLLRELVRRIKGDG